MRISFLCPMWPVSYRVSILKISKYLSFLIPKCPCSPPFIFPGQHFNSTVTNCAVNIFVLADRRETSNFRSAVFQNLLKLPKWLQPKNPGVIALQGKRITSLGISKKSWARSLFALTSLCASLGRLRGLFKGYPARAEVPGWTHTCKAHLWKTELL